MLRAGIQAKLFSRSNAQGPLVAGNLAAVAVAATRGAAAARKGDQEALRSACKQCHDDFRERYRGEFRTRALVTKTK